MGPVGLDGEWSRPNHAEHRVAGLGQSVRLLSGYNYELPSGIVLGAQADLSFPNLLAGTQTIAAAGIDIADYEQQVLFSGTLRGRLGYAFGPLLVYGTGGYALAQDEITRTQQTTGAEEARRSFRSGWAAGAGVETKVDSNWTANLEYLFTDLGSRSVTFAGGAQTFNSDLTFQNVRVGLNYRLSGTGNDSSWCDPSSSLQAPPIGACTPKRPT